ncbi:hypothetical protein RHSIM_Rhsim03G0133600 [Rhododendron simsii]|uniref:Protein FAR1-RELATED SEQUENCE n=1 Tax=Rhododendron simsii TaxID=118357 RepID=A0A834HJX6_RHOSS|nr:hypothetical protein RHSIM_Rhsim03G0133600 [Rhododendron simsii]
MEEHFDLDDFEVEDFQTPNNDVEVLESPSNETSFATIDEARKYYEDYGRQNGFWIRIRTSSKGQNRSNEVTSMLFVCAKEGKYCARPKNDGVMEGDDKREEDEEVKTKKRFRNCSTVRCDCKAHLRIRYDKWSSKWKVTVFNDTHNHQLVTPSKRMKMRSNRYMPKPIKDMTEVFQKENLEVSKVASIFGGEYMGFDNRDCYNHLRNVRHRELDGRDAQSVLTYFKNKQAQNPQFFYAIQCDESGRALEAMGGHPPTSIITDQDLAMKEAIAQVFPNTRHHLCLWHIKKFVEKLSQVYYKKSKFKKDVKKCIWLTYKKEDFEQRWMTLMKENGLEHNEWLQQLYEIRDSWVPVYNRGTLFAGMNTTGRSEGVNSFFDAFVTSTTNLKEFVVKYDQALKRIVKKESDEDFESEHKFRIVKDNEFLLKHATKVYTRNIFNKFKDKISEALNCKVEEMIDANGFQSFVVKSKVNELQKFTVTLDSQTYEALETEAQSSDSDQEMTTKHLEAKGLL